MTPTLTRGMLALGAVAFYGVAGAPQRVLVTGAGGRTGIICFQKLSERPATFAPPLGLVNSAKSERKVRKSAQSGDQVIRADIKDSEELATVLSRRQVDAMIICTSAVPKVKLGSIAKILLAKAMFRKPGPPEFWFPPGGTPEEVDYRGLVAQVDAARKAGVKRLVLVSSMGGTDKDNFLNSIGTKPDGTGGQILMWKRKGEKHLVDSGLDYTIVHPGGLIDEPDGQREIVMGVDDELLKRQSRSIPRGDVAEVCVQALTLPSASRRSVDIITTPPGEGGAVTTDYDVLFKSTERNCDYSIDPGEPKSAFADGTCH